MILVTGGSGFVGGAIAASLGDQAVTLGRAAGSTIKHIQFDLADTAKSTELIEQLRPHGITHIVHAAAVTPWSQDPDYSQDAEMAVTIARISNELDSVKQVLFLSGWNVYSMTGRPAPYDESTPVGPSEDYGKSKLKTEQYLKREVSGAKLANLRLSSLYGPGQTSSGLIPNLVRSALDKKTIIINAVQTSRDYLYIDDLAKAVSTLTTQELDQYLELNLGSGDSVSVEDVAKTIAQVCKTDHGLSVSIDKADDLHESDIIDNQLSIDRAQNEHNLLKYITPFEDGLARYISWVNQ